VNTITKLGLSLSVVLWLAVAVLGYMAIWAPPELTDRLAGTALLTSMVAVAVSGATAIGMIQ